MKLQPDDPHLTNYLLGECTRAERLEIEHHLRTNPELQKELEELQSLTRNLSLELLQEQGEGLKPDQIMAIERHIQSRRKIIRWNFNEEGFSWGVGIAVAASLVLGWIAFDRLIPSPMDPAAAGMASNTTSEIKLVMLPPLERAPEVASNPIAETFPETPSLPESVLSTGNLTAFMGNFLTLSPSEESQSHRASSDMDSLQGSSPSVPVGFLSSKSHTLASVALEARSRSYEAIQKSIQAGVLPSPEIVQIDSLINAFKVDDATPRSHEPFKVHIQLATSPWNPHNALARIALVAQKGSLEIPGPLARQVQWHFQLNPSRVEAYRILGYDDLPGKNVENFPADQVIPLNFQRVVLIEIIPTETTKTSVTPGEWLTVQVDYQSVEGQKIQKSIALQGSIQSLEKSSPDLQFTVAIAQFGALLKKLPNTEKASWNNTLELAKNGLGEDPQGERHQFMTLVEKAKRLSVGK